RPRSPAPRVWGRGSSSVRSYPGRSVNRRSGRVRIRPTAEPESDAATRLPCRPRPSFGSMTSTAKGQAMEPRNRRPFGPARIFALALIAIAIAGLAYLHFTSGSDSVSVPSGARAGDLELHDCTYGTEKGGYAADCGTLVVPENRADANSRLIALPVTRIHAR